MCFLLPQLLKNLPVPRLFAPFSPLPWTLLLPWIIRLCVLLLVLGKGLEGGFNGFGKDLKSHGFTFFELLFSEYVCVVYAFNVPFACCNFQKLEV